MQAIGNKSKQKKQKPLVVCTGDSRILRPLLDALIEEKSSWR